MGHPVALAELKKVEEAIWRRSVHFTEKFEVPQCSVVDFLWSVAVHPCLDLLQVVERAILEASRVDGGQVHVILSEGGLDLGCIHSQEIPMFCVSL